MSFFANIDCRYEQLASSHINIVESDKLGDRVVVVYMTSRFTLNSFSRDRVTGQQCGTEHSQKRCLPNLVLSGFKG